MMIEKMQDLIDPVDKRLLKKELVRERLLRRTNRSGNEIYVVTAHNAPHTMREIARLREEAFRADGGGCGRELDIDCYDTKEKPYYQLLVWNPDQEEILGGYRFAFGKEVSIDADGQPEWATSCQYRFSSLFVERDLSRTIELGRSFVTFGYQSSKAGTKALFALDNLWDGLGAISVMNPDSLYFFGKVTIYPTYPRYARNMIHFFWRTYFPDMETLIVPLDPLDVEYDDEQMSRVFCGTDYKEDYRILNQEVRKLGVNIPPLVNAYMNLSLTMRFFGTTLYPDFGMIEDSAILVNIADIVDQKKRRHLDSFVLNPDFVW